jgi:hypothetical protein
MMVSRMVDQIYDLLTRKALWRAEVRSTRL